MHVCGYARCLCPHAVSVVSATDILVVETGQIFSDNVELSVGNASDVFIDLQCTGEGDVNTLLWFRPRPTPTTIMSTFNQTITSYDENSGFLRVFLQDPDNIVANGGLVFLSCFRNFIQANVNLRPGENHCCKHCTNVFPEVTSVRVDQHYISLYSINSLLHWRSSRQNLCCSRPLSSLYQPPP